MVICDDSALLVYIDFPSGICLEIMRNIQPSSYPDFYPDHEDV